MKIEITIDEFIGRKVKEEREKNKIKQKDFAKTLRISPMMISHLEKGQRSWKTLLLNEISLYFHKDIVYFIKNEK